MIKIFNIVVLALLFLVGLAFATINASPVALNYYFGSKELPLSLIVVSALAGGALLGALASSILILRAKGESARLRRKLKVVEQEISALRALPTRDDR